MRNIERALLVAGKAHAGQSYGIYPYIYHLIMVQEVAASLGADDDVLVACMLHDILEDSDLSYGDIKKDFGQEVAEIVYAVTDELGRNRLERKRKTYPKIQSNIRAQIVKICDRIVNVRESKRLGKGMYNMYKKEQKGFRDAIDTVTAVQYHTTLEATASSAWDLLDESLKD